MKATVPPAAYGSGGSLSLTHPLSSVVHTLIYICKCPFPLCKWGPMIWDSPEDVSERGALTRENNHCRLFHICGSYQKTAWNMEWSQMVPYNSSNHWLCPYYLVMKGHLCPLSIFCCHRSTICCINRLFCSSIFPLCQIKHNNAAGPSSHCYFSTIRQLITSI